MLHRAIRRRHSTSSDGPAPPGAAVHGIESPGVAQAVWWGCRKYREGLHRQERVRRCDAVLVPAHPTPMVHGTCVCRDFVVDMLVVAERFLAGMPGLANPAGAARAHVSRYAAKDWIRSRRLEQGAQARTDRVRSGWYGQCLGETERAVLQYLVDEAGSPAPLDSEEQLVSRLAELLADEFGGSVGACVERVRAALPVVERVCRSGRHIAVGGVLLTWWEVNIEIPLGRRPRTSDEPVTTAWTERAVSGSLGTDLSVDRLLDEVLYGPDGSEEMIIATLRAMPPGAGEEWVIATVVRLTEDGMLPELVANSFAGDRERVRAALDAIARMNAAESRQIENSSRRHRAGRPRRGEERVVRVPEWTRPIGATEPPMGGSAGRAVA